MEIILGISFIFIILFLNRKFKQYRRNIEKFHNIIPYASNFLALHPNELTVHFDDIFYSELLDFVRKSRSNIINFEQIDDSAIAFNIRMKGKDYAVIGRRYIFDQLMISARAL